MRHDPHPALVVLAFLVLAVAVALGTVEVLEGREGPELRALPRPQPEVVTVSPGASPPGRGQDRR